MGYYFVFKVTQCIIRSDIRAMINSGFHREMFILIKIDHPESNPNFKKLDHDEFSYCGRLYDIIEETVKGNTTWYNCINDQQEEQLISGYEKIQSFASGTGSPDKTNHIESLLHNLVTLALVTGPMNPTVPNSIDFTFCQYSFHPDTSVSGPVPPPPDIS